MKKINNPILKGFNPDPSIIRVGNDFYIATSTFEWLPGIPIYHSTDLIHWKLISHVFSGNPPFNLRGVVDSAGLWAPSLSYHDGVFWVVYTVVHNRLGNFKDVHNYLVTSPDIHGPWSEPVRLNSSGFDPSLFHDSDGRKWLLNIQWDFRLNHPRFGGIVLQEYDSQKNSLIGSPSIILKKKQLIEGPNLYFYNGYYYLMLAEGGTSWTHAISMARSKNMLGPYECDPQSVLLTSYDNEELALQKAGHGEIVQLASGEWYLAHLASRPLGKGEKRRCILGRETCLQRVEWSPDQWLRLSQGGNHPDIEIPVSDTLKESPSSEFFVRDDFDLPKLDLCWCTLRVPCEDFWVNLSERPSYLRLRGRESMQSLYEQNLVAKRLQSFQCVVETCIEFEPQHFSQMAGLICWYDTKTHYYLRVTHDEIKGKILGIIFSDDGVYGEIEDSLLVVQDWERIYLRAQIDRDNLQFTVSKNESDWIKIGPVLEMSKLSDDYGKGLHFTGTFVGLCAQDLNGTRAIADFDYFLITY